MLTLGKVFIKIGDKIKMSFFVKDENVEEEDEEMSEINCTFATYTFIVEFDEKTKTTCFRTVNPSQNYDDCIEEVKTWTTIMTTIDINYIDDGTNGMTSQSYNSK